MKEVLVAGVKEVVIDIQLRENNTELTEVVVRPRVNKEATVNPSVLTGGVMLSMEEASRFAGGYNDPARCTENTQHIKVLVQIYYINERMW